MAERAPRTFWKGYLRLALVTIPVRLLTATRTDTTFHFHQIDRKTKQRIRYQKIVPGKGPVDKEDIVSGYEVEPGNYVLFEGDELNALKLETRHTIELSQFVNHCEIDPMYFDKPYYIVPDGDIAEEGYRVIRDALREEKKVGIGQLTLRGKENLVALQASGAGMLLETLRYEEEIKEADDVFTDIGTGKSRDDMVAMAKSLIKEHSGKFDPTKYKNHYAQALREFVESHVKKGEVVAVDADESDTPKKGQVVDFMEALRRSLKGGPGATATADASTKDAAPAQDTAPAKDTARAKDSVPAKDTVPAKLTKRRAPAKSAGKDAAPPVHKTALAKKRKAG